MEYTFEELQEKYKGEFSAAEVKEFWDDECLPTAPLATAAPAHTGPAATSAEPGLVKAAIDLKAMTMKEWVDEMGVVSDYLNVLEEEFDSPDQIISIYLKEGAGPDGENILEDEFFNDIGMTELGEKRLVNQWIGANT